MSELEKKYPRKNRMEMPTAEQVAARDRKLIYDPRLVSRKVHNDLRLPRFWRSKETKEQVTITVPMLVDGSKLIIKFFDPGRGIETTLPWKKFEEQYEPMPRQDGVPDLRKLR